MRFLKAITILLLLSLPAFASAKVEKKPNTRTKFYNFDAVIIDGLIYDFFAIPFHVYGANK